EACSCIVRIDGRAMVARQSGNTSPQGQAGNDTQGQRAMRQGETFTSSGSEASLFLVGRNSRGQWVVQSQHGKRGGLFVSLAALPAELSQGMFTKARVVPLAADQVVFLAGDDGDGCYRVDEGLLKVSIVASEGAERILAVLGPGSIVGELSMIDGTPRSATV